MLDSGRQLSCELQVDTDPGVDDSLAILLALASPELEILAITITFGNTDIENSHNNVLKLWQMLHQHFEKHPDDKHRFPIFELGSKGNIPRLARGSEGPLEGELHSAEYFHGRDGLADISERHPELSIPKDWRSELLQLTDQSAIDLSLDLIRAHSSRSITYIALGPLTNLARMMRQEATLITDRIGRVIAMGGALEAAGNVTAVAEFNFFADPSAVRELLHPQEPTLGLPLNRFVLLPLDVTTRHILAFPDYKNLVDQAFASTASPSQPEGKSPLVHFTTSFLERTAEVMRGFGTDAVELHDPITIWCAICNPPVVDETADGPRLCEGWVAQKRRFQIERTGELTRGMLVVDRREDAGNYQPGDNRAEVQAGRTSEAHHVDAAVVQVESKAQVQDALLGGLDGVAIVTDSPGPQVLVQFMLERIWGVHIEN